MPIENRHGVCAVCDGPIYRHPSQSDQIRDRWTHRRTADWITNPHEPQPKESE